MAKKLQHVWGLEIGQSSLKALRCHMEGDSVIADAFDFVEYPKILSQPEAEPEALVADALQQFISRNDLRKATVAVSVPGQSGLSKFFKPPPHEVKKLGDIVKYEAKQQIPFDLKDVIWDYQQMEGAQIEDGYSLESEVGLFAMKREAVFRALKPYRAKGIDIDLVQLAPISLYNMIAYDQFAERLATETFDPDAPQKSLVVLSIGTDASDLIVTNGFRVWQRNIPIGGNHFTRQLTKDLKLTFAKAEHLKRNALQADDPKLVFQAMRPVFNDMVTEIQRSLNFYKNVNKKGEFDSMLLLGNTSKLPGLQQFLNKNLGVDVHVLDRFPKLEGTEVTGAQPFKENLPAFGVVYGLCLQLLKKGPMRTSLLPRDIILERVIRNKKPWTVGALSLLLGAMVAHHASRGLAYSEVDATKWKRAEDAVGSMSQQSSSQVSKDGQLMGELKKFQEVGKEVSNGASRRVQTLELLKVIEAAMFKNPELADKTPVELPYKDRMDFHIESFEQKYYPDLETWFNEPLKTSYLAGVKSRRTWFAPTRVHEAIPDPTPLTGAGWVIELKGFHYFNGRPGEEGPEHVLRYMVEFLENGTIELPITNPIGIKKPEAEVPEETGVTEEVVGEVEAGEAPAEGASESVEGGNQDGASPAEQATEAKTKLDIPPGHVRIRDLGIRLPVIINPRPIDRKFKLENPEYRRLYEEQRATRVPGAPGTGADPGAAGFGAPGFGDTGMGGRPSLPVIKDEAGKEVPPEFEAQKFSFTLQFAWKPRFEPEGGSEAGGVIDDSAVAGESEAPASE